LQTWIRPFWMTVQRDGIEVRHGRHAYHTALQLDIALEQALHDATVEDSLVRRPLDDAQECQAVVQPTSLVNPMAPWVCMARSTRVAPLHRIPLASTAPDGGRPLIEQQGRRSGPSGGRTAAGMRRCTPLDGSSPESVGYGLA